MGKRLGISTLWSRMDRIQKQLDKLEADRRELTRWGKPVPKSMARGIQARLKQLDVVLKQIHKRDA